MDVPVNTKFKTIFKIDDLFKRGDIVLDKETDIAFFYRPEVHKENVFRSPNNYRLAHSGDIQHIDISTKQRLLSYYYKLKYKILRYVKIIK
jgi:hypothetical protein